MQANEKRLHRKRKKIYEKRRKFGTFTEISEKKSV